MIPQMTNSMTPIKRMSLPQSRGPVTQIPKFNCLVEYMHQYHLQMNPALTNPLSQPSPKSETLSIPMKNTLPTSKRSFRSLEIYKEGDCPVKMMKQQLLFQDSTKFGNWTQNLPLSSPTWHLPYPTTHKSQQVLCPPKPESTLWPACNVTAGCVTKQQFVAGLNLSLLIFSA